MADGGSVLQTARNYPIDATTEIQAGAVVKLSAGKVVLAAAAETGGILALPRSSTPARRTRSICARTASGSAYATTDAHL